MGVPLLAIAVVALSPYWNGDLSAITFTIDNVRDAFDGSRRRRRDVNTIRTSLLAAAIVLPLEFVAALALSGVVRAPRVVRASSFIFIAPLAVPRALLGMAVLFVFIQRPFSLYGSLLLFVIGYAFVILPFSLRSQYNSLIGVHQSLFEASRVCGASQLRMVAGIALPVARRGLAAALALAFVLLSNDFAVSHHVANARKSGAGHASLRKKRSGRCACSSSPSPDHDRHHDDHSDLHTSLRR